jgi:ACR3 family arsenite transporter
VARIALPLLAHFAVMWGGGYALGVGLGLGYQRTTTMAFTAAGNNFELAIAVIEVPVLGGLVYVALRKRFTSQSQLSST